MDTPTNIEEEFDKRQREVRLNNNTAQKVFEDKMTELIGGLDSPPGKSAAEFQFPIALSGSLDFSKLPVPIKLFLTRTNKLSFVPGEITDIRGWGVVKHMTELDFSRQLLTELDFTESKDLFGWKLLNLERNGLRDFNWKKCLSIKNVNFGHNRFVRLAVLPRTLEVLDVRNNRLELLDLSHGTNLRYINASNNTSSMVLVPPPRENNDYELIQTYTSPSITEPSIAAESEESLAETSASSVKEAQNQREAIHQKVDFQEGLKEYFRYRSEYEQKVALEKRELWKKYRVKKGASLSAARQMMSRYVPNCLNCEQPGGMIFQFIPEESKYKALCGARHPCNFRIEVFRSGDYIRLPEVMNTEFAFLEKCKQDMIIQKQEVFFNGNSGEITKMKKYKEIMELYEEVTQNLEKFKQQLDDAYSTDRQKRIDELTLQIGEWIAQNKALISPESVRGAVNQLLEKRRASNQVTRVTDWEDEEEEKGREEERLRMVTETEICSLFPLIQKLRRETYDVMEIEATNDGCRLVQDKIGFSKLEYNMGAEPPAMISFVK